MSPRFTTTWYSQWLARQTPINSDVHGVSHEKELHNLILAECKRRGWLTIHARLDRPSTIEVGTPDFVILAENGKVLFIECKTSRGKLRPEQQAFIAWANKLGHTVHVIRSFKDFQQLIQTS